MVELRCSHGWIGTDTLSGDCHLGSASRCGESEACYGHIEADLAPRAALKPAELRHAKTVEAGSPNLNSHNTGIPSIGTLLAYTGSTRVFPRASTAQLTHFTLYNYLRSQSSSNHRRSQSPTRTLSRSPTRPPYTISQILFSGLGNPRKTRSSRLREIACAEVVW